MPSAAALAARIRALCEEGLSIAAELDSYIAEREAELPHATGCMAVDPDTGRDDSAGDVRVLLRIWLSVPFSRALPDGHAVQWGDTRAGALRGGALVGRSAIAA